MYAGLIDMRSDTVTRPTAEMRKAMYEAEVGDDVYGEDPTVNELERCAGELMGKEAALFVVSGTMGNQVALFAHCLKGEEVIVSEESHIVQHEAGAGAHIAGVQLRTVDTGMGWLTWADIERRIRDHSDIHAPRTGLIEIENPVACGSVIPIAVLDEIYRNAQARRIPVHMDGARIFNASSFLGVKAGELARRCDSIMFCLSKGLCAPVGSMLAGSGEFIERARRRRKIMGGGMRQAGILAAAGLVALRKMSLRVEEDRVKMERLSRAVASSGEFEVFPEEVQVNMFLARFKKGVCVGRETSFAEVLKRQGILIGVREDGWIRFVGHNDVSFEDIETVCATLERALEETRKN
jgi:threonine aldolase